MLLKIVIKEEKILKIDNCLINNNLLKVAYVFLL